MAQDVTSRRKRETPEPGTARSTAVYSPNADIYETEDRFVLVADMPGVAPDDVEVTLERGVLTVRGRVPAEPHHGYRRVHTEYGVGDYERAFAVSKDIDSSQIEAVHRNGVLTLKMPKVEAAKTRKIRIKAA